MQIQQSKSLPLTQTKTQWADLCDDEVDDDTGHTRRNSRQLVLLDGAGGHSSGDLPGDSTAGTFRFGEVDFNQDMAMGKTISGRSSLSDELHSASLSDPSTMSTVSSWECGSKPHAWSWSVGSANHEQGACKPCRFMYARKGCSHGANFPIVTLNTRGKRGHAGRLDTGAMSLCTGLAQRAMTWTRCRWTSLCHGTTI